MNWEGLPDYGAVQDYLFGLKTQGVKFGIDRMHLLTEALGRPERSYPVIHIAGTNGKGSVSAMLESIFRCSGHRTGLYTSPHLVRLGERVQVDRQILTEKEIIEFVNELGPTAEKIGAVNADDHPSFFEFMTAMAFLQFSRRKVGVGIIEVGLGGKLDATNVVEPQVSVITSIGLDHTEMLGDTYEKIAAEKGGIIKRGRPVVIGRMPPEAEVTIRAIATSNQAPILSVREVFGEAIGNYPETNLEGDYQRWNAATAILICRSLGSGWKLEASDIARGLSSVDWPGRWQRTTINGRLVVLDASHNPEGAEVLETNLQQLLQETGRKPVILTGALGESRAKALLGVVAKFAKEIHLLIPQQPRASSYATLEGFIPNDFPGPVIRNTIENIFPRTNECLVGDPADPVVVTGSIYLLGEILAAIEQGRAEGHLQDF